MKIVGSDKTFQWIILLILAFIWGSSFILMKIGLLSIPYNELGALRLLIASFVLIPFGYNQWKKIERKNWKYLVIVGLCGSGIPSFLFAFAQQQISSSLAGMLNSLVPIFTLLLGITFFQAKAKKIHFLGVIAGLIGSFFLLFRPGLAMDSSSWYGLYVVLATLCYGTSVNTIKRYLNDLSSVVITSVSLFLVGPICGVYLFAFTDFTSRISPEPQFLYSIGAIALLAILATGMAVIIFNMLIKRVSALYASSVTYLIPIVAIGWGIFDGEYISFLQIGGMGAVLTGIYLINK